MQNKQTYMKPQTLNYEYEGDKDDLKTHRVLDEIEKLEIEHYLNQGPNPLVQEDTNDYKGSTQSTFQDHPRHKLDPALE